MGALSQLLGDGWRNLRRSLGTTTMAALLLGAGFAISLMVTSIAMVAFHGHGVPIPETVMDIGEGDGSGNVHAMRGTDVLKLREAAPELMTELSAVRTLRLSLSGASSDRNLSVAGSLVHGRLFDTLGWSMLHGRGFQDGDAQRGAAIIDYRLWRQSFASDPGVIGRNVLVDGRPVTIIGVLPDHRTYPFQEQLYLAHELNAQSAFVDRYWEIALRIEDAAQLDALKGAVAALQAERERLNPTEARAEPMGFRSNRGNGVPADSQVMINTLMIMGGLLLVLASSNAGGLLLVHWLARSRELATRSALGSTRGRLFAVCLLQSVMLVALALLVAHLAAAVLLTLLEAHLHSNSDGMPTYSRLSLEPSATWPVLIAALGCVLLVAAPVLWRLRDPNLQSQIRSGERGNSSSGWLGSGLFALQCLLSAVTVLLALLCAQGAREMLALSTGLDTRQVLTARISNSDPLVQERLGKALREAIAAQPELRASSISGALPMSQLAQPRLNVGELTFVASISPVDADYAAVYGVQLQQGEWISEAQVERQDRVAVLDRSAADLMFAGSALGRSFQQPQADGSTLSYTVIGVIQAVRTSNDGGPDQPSVFIPMNWTSRGGLVLAVRTHDPDPLSFRARLEQLAAAVDAALALSEVRSFAQVQHAAGSGYRLVAMLFGPLGMLALLLAATGLAALLGSLVARRMRELGIRRALGAGGGSLLRPLLRQLGIWGGCGLLLGLALSWPLATALSDGLFGGGVLGVLTYLVTLLTISAALILAAAAPVRRALRVDPMLVLRQE